MSKTNKWALSLCSVNEGQDISVNALEEAGFRVIKSSNLDDGLLKLSNQDFDFIILDMDSVGLGGREFVATVRKKEAKNNIKDRTPILICGSVASVFTRYFTHFDNVKFFELPFKQVELKEKIASFFSKADKVPEKTTKIKAGEILISEDGDGHEMFWILEGSFEIFKKNSDGIEVLLGEAKSGELVGEMSFLDNLPRSATIRAKTDCEIMIIPQAKFASVLDGQPRWFRSLMKTLSQRLRESNEKVSNS
jgi:CheY-like chemotaxis protein